MQYRMCATANSSLAMVTYIAAGRVGETGLVYEDRDDVAPDLDIGDAAYAITRYRECATVQRSEPIQTIDAQ